MINILLTILCSTSIALILKQNSVKSGSSIVLLTANYFAATVISLFMLSNELPENFEIPIILFGCLVGGLFVISFFAFSRAVGNAGTGLATTSSRLSVIVPVILSMLVLKEMPGVLQTIGLFGALVTIILFYFSLKNEKGNKENRKAYFYLFGVLVGIGIGDFCMKIFESQFVDSEKSLFLLSIFGSAFCYTLIISLISRKKFDQKTISLGLLLGIPNIFSSYFLINALTEFKAVIVFPIVNIGIILLTTLLAIIIWKEKINNEGILALVVGIFAIVLLSL
ncbi:MAG: EamA family transporter [Melioribacteraceae bacterium]|nr:EamA family transporter [Melioribacteraceae bacterium]MCF8263836.1 EamA family transporter [Melioribacteraceae bacterium]MCF8432182.1 EamA family transporter [Melioribacteraceae bacterium]